ncbi:MAG: hypothetical protein RIS29_403 [Bacteroidota bacterium]
MLSPEEKLVLNSLKLQPTEEDQSRTRALLSEITNWQLLVKLLTDRGLAPLFLNKTLNKEQLKELPDSARWVLQQVVFKTLSRNMVLYNSFSNLLKELQPDNVEVMALKGICLAENLYGDIQLRQMSDIDILVLPEHAEYVLKALNKLGFQAVNTGALSNFVSSKSDFVHYAPMVFNGISVEVHIRLHQINDSVQINIDRLWKKSEKVILNGVEARKMDFYHQLIHLCVHLHKHFTKGHVQFTSFADIANLLLSYQDIDATKLESMCTEYNCSQEVYPYLMLVHEFCHVPLPVDILNKHKACLQDNARDLFIKYLNGYEFEEDKNKSAVPAHISNLKRINTLSDFVRYVSDLLFPSKSFMIEKYGIGSKKSKVSTEESSNNKQQTTNYKLSFWWLWYPYRWAVGVKGLLQTFKPRRP